MPSPKKRIGNNKNTKKSGSIRGNGKKDKKLKKDKKPKSKAKKIILGIVIGFLLLLLIAAGILAGIVFGIFKKYSIPVDLLRVSSENTVVLDTDGNIIATLNGDERRECIKINEMTKYLPAAFVAIEDERFYDHQGIDIKRTAAATLKYVFKGGSSFGGSTITQQLVKNITKEDERDATRKIKEMARAYNLEKTLTKDEILELYLNMIFMGEHVYGVQMASRLYFDKNASELDLAEAAFLAGINNSPNAYKPFSDDPNMKEKIRVRTITVINKMHDLGKIESDEIYKEAIEKTNNGLVFTKGNVDANNYSYHTDALIQQVIKDVQKQNPDMTDKAAEYYVYNGGLTIYSTQVTPIQNVVEEEYKNTKYLLKSYETKIKDSEGNETDQYATSQSAMVILDHKTGQVIATVGGFGEKTSRGFNRATQAVKQPGSSIKPLAVIAPSLEENLITAATVVDDTSMGAWPQNSGGGFLGLMTVRNIIKVSRNIPEVKMIKNLGPEKSVEFLKKLGITTVDERDANSALALGGLTQGVTPLQMAGAYATIANDGVYIEPTFYTKVEDSNGNVILEAKQEKRTVMSADNAYILKSILRGPVSSGGTYPAAKFSAMDVCAKTGTTDSFTERWLCGFTPYYTATTWYGYDKTEVIRNGGYNTAAQIWTAVMKNIHTGLEIKTFEKTGNIISARVCSKSGLLPGELCGDCVIYEEFVKGTVPTETCNTHVAGRICIQEDGTKKLATEFCPNAIEQVFITRPDAEEDTSWKTAGDAGSMLPIETCEVHTHPVETKPTPEPVVPTEIPTPQSTPKVTPTPIQTQTPVVTTPTPTVVPSIATTPVQTPVPPVVTTTDPSENEE